jgi:anaerobic ribonucleoside-triphosphate reductase activating protein
VSGGNGKLIRVAQIVDATEAEGPGRRAAIWVQGCPLHCAGCCNPEMWPAEGGTGVSVGDLLQIVERAHGREGIEGITLLGGEPFAQAAPLAEVGREVQRRNLSVMTFTGYTLAELRAMSEAAELLEATDLLVDGRYERDRPDKRRRWIGSENQVLHFLSDRYDRTDPRLSQPNTIELRLRAGSLTVNGCPEPAEAFRMLGRKKAHE